jgi:hypothetical protein
MNSILILKRNTKSNKFHSVSFWTVLHLCEKRWTRQVQSFTNNSKYEQNAQIVAGFQDFNQLTGVQESSDPHLNWRQSSSFSLQAQAFRQWNKKRKSSNNSAAVPRHELDTDVLQQRAKSLEIEDWITRSCYLKQFVTSNCRQPDVALAKPGNKADECNALRVELWTIRWFTD